MKINWTTMSRLYNPKCVEFTNLFNKYINHEFAKEYNPYYKYYSNRDGSN